MVISFGVFFIPCHFYDHLWSNSIRFLFKIIFFCNNNAGSDKHTHTYTNNWHSNLEKNHKFLVSKALSFTYFSIQMPLKEDFSKLIKFYAFLFIFYMPTSWYSLYIYLLIEKFSWNSPHFPGKWFQVIKTMTNYQRHKSRYR